MQSDAHTSFPLPRPGDRLGSLRIVRTIAAGGMAIVYEVLHEELEVRRAIKLLKPDSKEEHRRRLQTEAKIAAHLHHPNIVQIYGVSLWRATLPYIEMEYVEGTSLQDFLAREGRLPFMVAAAVAATILRALEHARMQRMTVYGREYRGLVHRDVKPANILISSDGAIKLTDFGIALPGNESIHTVDAGVLGTAPYMSPEHLQKGVVDHRADLYSTAALLYEMVTGVKAFPQSLMSELIREKMRGKYRPSRSIVPDLPDTLVTIIEKGLALTREKRYATAGDMGTALEEMLSKYSDKPLSCTVREFFLHQTADTGIEHTSRRIRRILRPLLVLLCLGVGVTIGFLFWVNGSSRNRVTTRGSPAGPGRVVTPSGSTGTTFDSTPAAAGMPLPAQEQERSIPVQKSLPPQSAPKDRVLPQKPPASTLFVRADSLFGAGVWEEAAAGYTAALTAGLSPEEGLTARLRRIDACIHAGRYGKATHLLSEMQTDDGYYELLRGRIFVAQNELDKAEAALRRAQMRLSRVEPRIQERAVYSWARLCEKRYRQKPNRENRLRAQKAFSSYISGFCGKGGATPRCRNAHMALAGFAARQGM